MAFVVAAGGVVSLLLGYALTVQAQTSSVFAAVPGERGGQDITGPYEVVADWPKDISTLPDHEGWTWALGRAYSLKVLIEF